MASSTTRSHLGNGIESFSSGSDSEEVDQPPSLSPIAAFYKDKSIFITGATGFMGKVLVEKLLRSTPVNRIFLLIRQKRGVPSSDRLEQLLAAPIFDAAKEANQVAGRVVGVSGDITLPGLGLSPEDERTLVSEVGVVFHSAATIRFDEKMTEAVKLNVIAVESIMNLARKMRKLEALVHVSTAYVNTELSQVPEEIQDYGDPRNVMTLTKVMDPDLVNSLTTHLIGKKPNTYTYTKALGESLLQKEGGDLPIAIVRPSMVAAAWKEPIPGWVENLNGPTGILAASGKGVMRTMWAKPDMVADFIPVDTCINLMVAVAWRTAVNPMNPIPVYNCTSGSTNPLTWRQLQPLGLESFERFPFEGVFRYPYATHRETFASNWVAQTFQHSLPAQLVDLVTLATGGKPLLGRAVQKMHRSQAVLHFFTTNEYEFVEENLKNLQDEMHPDDRKIFNFDIADLEWAKFLDNWTTGCRQFVFKEPLSSLPEARRRQNRLWWIERIISAVIYLLLGRLLLYLLL